MISLIEALNFRCLRYVSQPLSPFHVLIGPNASGKTTFLDVVSFLGHLVSEGLDYALSQRSQNFQDLVWKRKGSKFELAIEANIPQEIIEKYHHTNRNYTKIRYEIIIGEDESSQEISILNERIVLKKDVKKKQNESPQLVFPFQEPPPETIIKKQIQGNRTIFNKSESGNVTYYSEIEEKAGKGWKNSFKLGVRKSALGNLPEDESIYPATTWLKSLLAEGVQEFVLNSLLIRQASPPGQVKNFKSNGSNLPWVLHNLIEKTPNLFKDWLMHVQTALPDIENIETVERGDDRHRYLVINYRGGLTIPSWMISDGTLRLLALTLPAYLPDFKGVYLIEEPENGIHPRAVETFFQSLSSAYNAQILLATHSPVVLSIAEIEDVLCFAKTQEGATDIVKGNEHPKLQEWKGEVNLGVLFASGVLG